MVATATVAAAAKSGGTGHFMIKLMSLIKTQIIVAALVTALAATFIVQSHIHSRQKEAAPPEVADISYNFPNIPVNQVFSVYASLAKEKLRIPDRLNHTSTIRVVTPRRITRSEAIKLLETALLEQAQIIITRSTDGTLVATPKLMPTDSSFFKNARTYLPDGTVDPPAQ